jgi:hypothetical protein
MRHLRYAMNHIAILCSSAAGKGRDPGACNTARVLVRIAKLVMRVHPIVVDLRTRQRPVRAGI